MPTPKQLLRKEDVTRLYRLTDRAIRYQVKAGKFPAPKYINGRCVWTEDVIAEHQAQVMQEKAGEHLFTKTPVTPAATSAPQQTDYGSQAIKPTLTEPSEHQAQDT